ncbi:heavy metal-binding domain-containing protein [Mucilaginibacter paludis]|uniref:Heavy metal binding domain-containing protein n=1 Tax=Mucilaginibacter paludis DSM 18603 TaxID=714943 RepID=H1YEZ7_9SPHI|nr:heavy metal-binding domain-containing protein [Mucilaginibacter paludis]EHQ25250.1 hypothetical protein Mucpa_1080 [Mucilaginibacter paludis DSM 18603]
MKIIIMLTSLLILVTACNSNQPVSKADTLSAKKVNGIQYTCPMHPAVVSSKPGTCPKCGMELVEKDDSK